MERIDKLKFIDKYINLLDIDKKEYICKILITYNIMIYQSNNGIYCNNKDLNNDIINKIYDYIKIYIK